MSSKLLVGRSIVGVDFTCQSDDGREETVFARATTLRGSPDSVEAGVQQYRDTLSRFRQLSGNQGAFLLIDRSSGKGIGVTLWESEQAMVDSREQANQLRQQAAQEAGGQIESVEEYEVAVWDMPSLQGPFLRRKSAGATKP